MENTAITLFCFRATATASARPSIRLTGTLYDPLEKEVIVGATCTLEDNRSGETFTAETDNFGDFWFRGLKDDRTFTLTLEKGGKSKTIKNIATTIDLSLGDIPMKL